MANRKRDRHFKTVRGATTSSMRPGQRPTRTLRAVRFLCLFVFATLVIVVIFGGLSRQSSVANAAEVPAQCIEYESLAAACFGSRASQMPKPWDRGRRHDGIGIEQLAKQCEAKIRQLKTVCK